MAEINILKAGLYSSIQDLGRFGYRKFGVPISGVMDQYSSRKANLLVNNNEGTAVMEITIQGPQLMFSDQTIIALCGADLSPTVNGTPVAMNKATVINAGEQLDFGQPKYGCRCYLSINGGFKSEKTLNSYSQYASVTKHNKIESGDILQYVPQKESVATRTKIKVDTSHFESNRLDVFKGPEYDLLNGKAKDLLQGTSWQIGSNSRMGYHLSNPDMPENAYSITTSQVVPGTVQLTPSGRLMILMRDAQVTGGYPRVLQLTDQSINQLAQKTVNQQIVFDIKPL